MAAGAAEEPDEGGASERPPRGRAVLALPADDADTSVRAVSTREPLAELYHSEILPQLEVLITGGARRACRGFGVRRMLALRARRVFAPLSRNALPRLSCARQLCTPAAKPEEPADDGEPKLLYEGGKNKVLCVRTPDAWPSTRFSAH